MADRNTPETMTLEQWRIEFNELAADCGDFSTLGNAFSGTPTTIVEACNNAPSRGFTIAMAAALG